MKATPPAGPAPKADGRKRTIPNKAKDRTGSVFLVAHVKAAALRRGLLQNYFTHGGYNEQKTGKEESNQEDSQKNNKKEDIKKEISARVVKKKTTKREILAKELGKLIPKIDEKGLAFLIKQSHTIIYNLHVDEMNKALARIDRAEKRTIQTVSEVEAAKEKSGVWIEDAPGGVSFVMVLGPIRKVFSRVELRKLVAIAKSASSGNSAGDDGARSEQLYTWFQRHRGDVLFDGRIGARRHPLLVKLSHYLRTHYTVKN